MVAAVIQTQSVVAVQASVTRLAGTVALLKSSIIRVVPDNAIACPNAFAMRRAVIGADTRPTINASKSCIAAAMSFPANAIAVALVGARKNLTLVTAEPVLAAAAAIDTVLTTGTQNRAVDTDIDSNVVGGIGREHALVSVQQRFVANDRRGSFGIGLEISHQSLSSTSGLHIASGIDSYASVTAG